MADDETSHHEYAAECVRQAEKTDVPEQKALLLTMAQAWERLATQSERIRALLNKNGFSSGI
jgi:hypothetical protein